MVNQTVVLILAFKVLTVVTIKSTIFCNVTPCGPVEAYWRFLGKYLSFAE
jgi:uncharacterized membrane protein YeiB